MSSQIPVEAASNSLKCKAMEGRYPTEISDVPLLYSGVALLVCVLQSASALTFCKYNVTFFE